MQQQLAKQYATCSGFIVEHATRSRRVTFWGVTDGDSWQNDWPVRGAPVIRYFSIAPASRSPHSSPSSALQVSLLRSDSFGEAIHHRIQGRFPGSERKPEASL